MGVYLKYGARGLLSKRPFTHARIGYKNIIPDSTIVVSSIDGDNNPINMQTEATYNGWRPTALQAIARFDLAQEEEINYLAFVGSDIQGKDIRAEYSLDNVTWFALTNDFNINIEPAEDGAQMFLFPRVRANYLRLIFNLGSGSAAMPFIYTVYAGMTLDMERQIYGGVVPTKYARMTKIKPNVTESGQFAGKSKERQGKSQSFTFEHLTPEFAEDEFDDFCVEAQGRPFFIAWNPEERPQDCMFGWTNQDIVPENMGLRDFLTVSFDVMGVK